MIHPDALEAGPYLKNISGRESSLPRSKNCSKNVLGREPPDPGSTIRLGGHVVGNRMGQASSLL